MKWSASLICADLFTLQEALHHLETFQIEFLHIDVMDGLFVPRLGMYPEMVRKIKEESTIPVEVHLMIQNPEQYIPVFRQAGADIITIHLEACQPNLIRSLETIQASGAKAGLALNPGTDLPEQMGYAQEIIDYLLIMGINPGIIGQKIKPFIFEKIKKYHLLFKSKALPVNIIVDGGVNFENYQVLFKAGAEILVGGSQTIFHPVKTIAENLSQIKNTELASK